MFYVILFNVFVIYNGKRMRIKFIHRNAIDCEVLTNKNFDSKYKFNIFLFYHLTFKELNFQLYLHLQ
jgi:hypothetical protein